MKTTHILNKLRHGAAQLRITHYALCIGLALTTSCADMLQPENDLVMYPEDNQLLTSNDTIYSVTGTLTLMQKVADRVNLLGEVRGDLVSPTEAATTNLKNLAQYRLDSIGEYNQVADYYAIINNCNYFINTVDTTYAKRGQQVFIKEYAVMKTYRAWTYLQLALAYGEVPFYTHFLASDADGREVLEQPKRDLDYICDYFIKDLAPFTETPLPAYGAMGGYDVSDFFIPVRVLLGEMCLYSGHYLQAAQYYHDFLVHPDKPRRLGYGSVRWSVTGPNLGNMQSISGSMTAACSPSGSECLCFIPMEDEEMDGTVSHLDDIYESTEDNFYYYQLSRSEALIDLSANQNYCFVYEHPELHTRDTTIVHPGDTVYDSRMKYGDLRLWYFVSQSTVHSNSNKYSTDHMSLSGKIYTDGRCLYRTTQIYLHYAEALNRAGYPSAAMLVLKYGCCDEYVTRYVDPAELEQIAPLLSFPEMYFERDDVQGIHSRGCGNTPADTTYVLPLPAEALATAQDTVEYQIPLVEDMIMDEAALELCFEGHRFNDLVRIARRRGDPSYLADRVARRDGTLDTQLRELLMTPKNWYLPLPH